MERWLALIPAFPLAGFVILALLGRRLAPRVVASVGVGSVALSTILTAVVGTAFLRQDLDPGAAWIQTVWTWISVGDLEAALVFRLDALSLVMITVITLVGFLIHLYSVEFMAGDDGYARFFAYMNLFVAAMLTLVLGANLLPLFIGWEGVGLCSYLLIGFWYREAANGAAAQKAFYMTRIGDTAFLLGLFLLWTQLGTLDIDELLHRAAAQWPPGSGVAIAAAALLLGGAIGKSAQVPLQTWLPDAMAGPTPVSALIHAATMVTAGVYLVARMHPLYTLAPTIQILVGVIGAATLLLAAVSACVQRDIKRVLAYSTISQIGYMFLALGVGAWSAALFHFMTHAFFKALLFLAAGAVILALHHEHDIFRMGGLARRLPVTFWTFLIGAASLAGLPFLTAGFFSKDWILAQAWLSPVGRGWLWAAGVFGALLTAFYSARLVFLVFFGQPRTAVGHRPGARMTVPLLVLAALSIGGGWLEMPATLGDVHVFSDLIEHTLPVHEPLHMPPAQEWALQLLVLALVVVGIGLAYVLVFRAADLSGPVEEAASQTPARRLQRFWFEGWGFDRAYETLVAAPFRRLAARWAADPVDRLYERLAELSRMVHGALSNTQTGELRWYVGVFAAGSAAAVALVLLW